jgi:hypothetical protein
VRKTLDWKRSRISVFEVEAGPHSCIPWGQTGLSIALWTRILLLVESFGECHSQLLPFCEYVFLPGKSHVEVQPEILDIFC